MPLHQRVTTCRNGGPVTKSCTCEHCTLAVCAVCGAYEGGLTTHCPGTKIDFDKQQEIHETSLDYTEDRGWHLAGSHEAPLRWPRFETAHLPPAPPTVDPRAVVAPSIDWATVDRTSSLQHELTQRAIAWVIADRACDDQSARLTCAETAITDLRGKQDLDEQERSKLAALGHERVRFQAACRHVEKCDEELRQTARRLVAVLEDKP